MGVSGDCRAVVVVSRTSIRMVVRRATPEDSRAIATIHVLSWQATYQGVVPAQFLASMSVDRREGVWRGRLEQGVVSSLTVSRRLWNLAELNWLKSGSAKDSAPNRRLQPPLNLVDSLTIQKKGEG
jgi:hypothetical protein